MVEENGVGEEVKEIVLSITLDPKTNNVNVSGPIGDKILSYGMLDCARDLISEFHLRKIVGKNVAREIIPPNEHRIMDFLRGRK